MWPLVSVIELPFIILLDSSKDETEIGGDHCTVVLLIYSHIYSDKLNIRQYYIRKTICSYNAAKTESTVAQTENPYGRSMHDCMHVWPCTDIPK